MSYDQWKTDSGYDERDPYDEPEDECEHADYEADISGRATCNRCQYSWWQTEEEIAAEVNRIREYDEWQRRQERREFWRRLTHPIRWPIYLLLNRIWPRKACRVLTDDEIPF